MPCAKPNDLRLVFIKLQAITGHPIANAFKAAGEAFNCFLARMNVFHKGTFDEPNCQLS